VSPCIVSKPKDLPFILGLCDQYISANRYPSSYYIPPVALQPAPADTSQMHLPVASSSRLTETDPSVRPKARASRACSSCNRQKLRCDGAQPCSRCLTLAIVGSCEYLPSLRGKTRRRKDQSRETEDDGSKRNRIDSEEDVESQRQKEDPRLTMWHKDNAYREFAPTNAALWGEDTVRFPTMNGVPSLPSASPDLSRSGPHRRNVSMSEKLTSLPLPGDAHNPLAVLAEASATAHSDHDVNSPHTTFQDGSRDLKTEEAGGYYMPMEREMKDEAPHIMSYIKVHE